MANVSKTCSVPTATSKTQFGFANLLSEMHAFSVTYSNFQSSNFSNVWISLDQEHPVDEDLDYPDHSSNSQSNLSKQTNPMQPGILY